MIDKKLLIEKYFEENKLIQSNIDSFNSFIEWRLQNIIDEQKDAVPAVIPPDVEEVKFEFSHIRAERPTITEADGAKRKLLPTEARLRNITYSATLYMEIGLIIDGKERERAEVQICDLPVMLKSSLCHLSDMNKEELIVAGEDPDDTGGYFIIDGTERVLVLLEDLAPNQIFTKEEKLGAVTHSARIFSTSDNYRIPHSVERTKEGIYSLSFTVFNKIPFVVIMKALGLVKDKDIVDAIGMDLNDDLYINVYEFIDIKTQKDAQEFIAKSLHLALPKERKIQRVSYMLDNLLLPHVGKDVNDRINKAYFIGRMIKKLVLLKEEKIKPDDRDHYMNKRVRLAGDLMEDLFSTNFKVLVNDLLYIFQRGVRRGRLIPILSIVRTKLLTQRIKSAMATGKWTSNRQGVSQRLERDNIANTISHLRAVVSLLESTRESFEARELHPTHWGRLCPLESPEGKNIGLRKNVSILSKVSPKLQSKDIKSTMRFLEDMGLEHIK